MTDGLGDHVADLEGQGFELRIAGSDDADLIRRVLAQTISWRSEETPHDLPAEVAAYHEGWPRADDLGVLAFRGIEFAGGAYARRVGPADGTYGYFDDHFHEISIAVEARFRRQALGQLLLVSLQAHAMQHGLAGLSLSVESDNPARFLYRKAGFDLARDRGADWLMAWRSPAHREETQPGA